MTRLADAGVLYIVATPIGHLGDLSRRAEDVLKQVQIIAAEDTRRTRVLLDHIGHRAPELLSLHAHNEASFSEHLLTKLQQGADIAVVSDAGTPLLNDPGYPLVSAAHTAGIQTVPVPGACSIITALSVCPLPSHPFRYVGFLPAKATNRKTALAEYLSQPDALVFLEAPHRILATLGDLASVSSRRVMVARELTKTYETLLVGTPEEVAQQLGGQPKGEITCVVEAAPREVKSYDHQQVLKALLSELSVAKAAKVAATICGTRKSQMYELALEMTNQT